MPPVATNANDHLSDTGRLTLELVSLYLHGIKVASGLLLNWLHERNPPQAVHENRIAAKDKFGPRGAFQYRVEGQICVLFVKPFRIEFCFDYDGNCELFDEQLLRKHISLNKHLRKYYPQFRDLDIAAGLTELTSTGMVYCPQSKPFSDLLQLTAKGKELANKL